MWIVLHASIYASISNAFLCKPSYFILKYNLKLVFD